ncbi:MAG: AMP-binding protein [Halovenus sp.]
MMFDGIPDLLAARTAVTPNRTALVDTRKDREWTVATLDGVVDDVAAQFSAHLDGTESPRVACLLSTRFAFAATLHASIRIGATLVALGADRAADAVRAQCLRVDPDLLVCEAETEALAVGAGEGTVLSADDPERERVGSVFSPATVDDVERTAVDPDDTAVILFTSGTTGEPKAVRLTARNLTASATASAFRLGIAPDDTWLCCLAPHHMGGLAPFYRTVLYGTTLALQPGFDTDRTARVLREYDVTGVSLVPTQLTRLLDAGWSPPPSLGTVLLGGAPASASLVERALDAGVPLFPTYGLTETASQVATARPSEASDDPGSVGQPLLFTDVTIRDDGPGETGEIVVDGPTVTPGYLDPQQTAAAFCADGLRTGDLGWRDEAGRLHVVGRRDDMILTGGKLVAPSTVADLLRTHDGVDDAVVVGLDDEEWGERVVALVVADPELTAERLRAFCRDRLAGYKCPKTIRFATELPRTASGTVDREAVRDRF